MGAPLNVHIVLFAEAVHNDIRTGAPVENVTHNVQMVTVQGLNHLTHSLNHRRCLSMTDNRFNDGAVLIRQESAFVTEIDQLINEGFIPCRDMGANLGSCIER